MRHGRLFCVLSLTAALAGGCLLDDEVLTRSTGYTSTNTYATSSRRYPNVVKRSDGKYYPAPGYTWVNPSDPKDMRVRWKPGKVHTDHKNVVASVNEGKWNPAPGYKWLTEKAGDLRVVWSPGKVHSQHPHVIASVNEGKWNAAPGYKWASQSAKDLRVLWSRGSKHPRHKNVVAADEEGRWRAGPGYKWANAAEADLSVVWAPKKRHPKHPNIWASPTEGNWRPCPGYQWANPDTKTDLRVAWRPGTKHPEDPTRVAAPEEGHWIIRAGGTRPPAPSLRQKWAVVIGISTYKYASARLKNLRYCHRDAEVFARFLRSPAGGGFPAANVKLLTNENATKAAITDALFEFLKHTVKEDLVVIFFSCHGSPDPDKPSNLYLVAHDTRPGKIASTGFPMWDLNTAMRRTIGAERIVVLADACHSAGVTEGVKGVKVGSHFDRYYEQLAKSKPGRCVFTSSEGYETSRESARWGGGHGVFTWSMLRALRGAADRDGSGIVTLGEMLDFVDVTVRRETANEQHPTHAGSQFDRNLPMAVVK